MDLLILVGPNGAGKSTVGRALADTGRFTYLDLEAFFVQRYGVLEAYRANRPDAYRQFEAEVRAMIGASARPVVFEEVGLNDSSLAMLAALRRDYRVEVVELVASADACRQRAAQRTGGERFPKTADDVQDTWQRFVSARSHIGPIDARIDTEIHDVSSIVTTILHRANAPQ